VFFEKQNGYTSMILPEQHYFGTKIRAKHLPVGNAGRSAKSEACCSFVILREKAGKNQREKN
jgi:hypothetical protein